MRDPETLDLDRAPARDSVLTVERGGRTWDLLPALRWAVAITAAVVLTALSARISLPIPGTPVPFTFQPLAVLLCGALLGRRMGAAGQLAYLAAGVAGLPVFAGGAGLAYLLGPTGGYLMAYPAAAFIAGAAAGGGIARSLAGLLGGLAAIYAGGLAWLAAAGSLSLAVALGLKPFILADLVKVALALIISRRFAAPARRLFGRGDDPALQQRG